MNNNNKQIIKSITMSDEYLYTQSHIKAIAYTTQKVCSKTSGDTRYKDSQNLGYPIGSHQN
jgi:hypothetical protein